ncbi:MAG TPA: anti-sigma factor [Candidatus Methylomirabilis sp.]|nr:anti-sigma factor [Candidatus Methylomirabilis sp.]
MNHEEWLAQAEIYALGALDGAELTQFEAHLAAGCGPCEARVREAREALLLLPRSLPPVSPPPAVKARLLSQITPGESRRQPRLRPAWFSWGMGVAWVAAASLLIVLGWSLFATRQAIQRLEAEVERLRAEAAERDVVLGFLSDPQVRLVRLAGLPASPGASGKLLWNPTGRVGLLLTAGLPVVPADKSYELWAIAGNEPVPAGVFRVDQRGQAVLRLPQLRDARAFDKFAVTLEPAGGVPTPSGPMHLLGSL